MLYIFLDHEFSSKLRSIFHDVAQMFVQNKTSNEVDAEPPSIFRTPCLMGIIPVTRSYDEQQQLHERI